MVVLSGCGASNQPTLVRDPVPVQTGASKEAAGAIDPAKLPKLADPLPPLDGGRVEVAAPEEWKAASRDPRWLARFILAIGSQYPSILVTAEEAGQPTELNGDTVDGFAGQVRDELAKRDSKSLPEVRPLVVDGFVGVYYEDSPRTRSAQLDRMTIATLAGGRKYTVELQALSGTLEKYRDAALAVALGMKFLKPEANSGAQQSQPGG
jgi:hypothetical protein